MVVTRSVVGDVRDLVVYYDSKFKYKVRTGLMTSSKSQAERQ